MAYISNYTLAMALLFMHYIHVLYSLPGKFCAHKLLIHRILHKLSYTINFQAILTNQFSSYPELN